MQLKFTTPLSNTSKWEGQLHVTAEVDGRDAEITNVVLEDKNGQKANITYYIEQHTSNYDDLCEMAVNNAFNTGEMEAEDYTMIQQDNY